MWLYTVKALAPYRSVASKYGDLRTRGPIEINGIFLLAVIEIPEESRGCYAKQSLAAK
jgi:hypothetical protein